MQNSPCSRQRSFAPFVVLQLTGLALVAAFPQLALWLPQAVLR
jgi:TRAP-type C4-dicarboxylate transport system permease large subunit